MLPSVHGLARPTPRASPAPAWSPSKNCYGVWPGSWGGQGTYQGNCYGHDEPGLDPYSNLPGSGGNVTWQVTLPVDGASPTLQANLYSAIWFGLVLSAPGAWLNECFLELQLYPDQSWTVGGVTNTWDAAAVAWQIDVTNGAEDACYYSPLGDDATGGFLEMHGGDHLSVALSGSTDSPLGEHILLTDRTQGNRSSLDLYDFQYNAPLDPAYPTDSYPNALQWTPGGELPVSFAFEIGHTAAPYPNNNSFGGCSAGPFPPSARDPATPCPSYDPGLWSNGSQAPWEIAPPVFSNATTQSGASQITFSQDFGGLQFIDGLSNGTCAGRDGSAFCSYPWYSFSCATHAFTFGATPYPGTAAELGGTHEYNPSFVQDLEGNGYYSTTNVTVPTCGEPAATVTLSASGTTAGLVRLLDRSSAVGGPPVVFSGTAGLSPGNYSLDAVAPPSSGFLRWNAAGAISVLDPTNPWSSAEVAGNGTITGVFGAAPTLVNVTLLLAAPHGYMGGIASLRPDFAGTLGPAITLRNGSSLDLAPGIYSVEAYSPSGYNFTRWSISGGSELAAPWLPFTWLVVSRLNGLRTTLTVGEVVSVATATVNLKIEGTAGTVDFAGTRYTSSTSVTLPVGTYPVVAIPGAGSRWLTSETYNDSMLLDLQSSTNLTLQQGLSEFDVQFEANISVLLETTGGAGAVSWRAADPSPNGTRISPDQTNATSYPIAAVPRAGEKFTGWTVNNSVAASFGNRTRAVTTILLNASVTVVAHFASGASVNVRFDDAPASGGEIRFNLSLGSGSLLSNGAWDNLSTTGEYLVQAVAASGYAFSGWSVTGGLSVGGAPGFPGDSTLNVTGSGGTLTATFTAPARVAYPVTFVSSPAGAFFAHVNGTPLPSGFTTHLYAGNYPLSALSLGARMFGAWVGTTNLSTAPGANATTVLNITGSGTIYALAAGSVEVRAAVSPSVGAAPFLARFTGTILNGTAPFNSSWDFGDGSPVHQALDANHTFVTPGNYTARLAVSDATGGAASFWVHVRVTGVPLAVRSSLSALAGDAPLSVMYFSNDSGGFTPYRTTWSFGDGTNSTLGNGTHLFSAPGSFGVTLRVSDATSSNFTRSWTVSVHPLPTVALAANATSGPAPLDVLFSAAPATGTSPSTFAWSFGDGGSAGNSSNVHHQFVAQGNYTVELLLSDAAGVGASAHLLLVVGPPIAALVVSLAVTPGQVEVGHAVTFEALPAGGVAPYRYSWLGLPTGCLSGPPASPNLSCTPLGLGYYNVTVQVADARGKLASSVAELLVTQAPSVTQLPPPHAKPAPSLWLLEGVIAVLAVAAALALLFLYTRYRRSAAAKEPDVPEPERRP
ncbi:MAG: PKD domain-containing protein [Thermoplasmata archaeon]|nr:PKD domain-containing protein [Thermoplasmata archaeon]